MKILHLIHSLNPKGGGIAASLKETPHHEATLLALDDPNAPFLKNYQQPVIALGPSISGYGYTKKLIPWLNQNLMNFDAAVIHGIWQFHGLGFLLSKKPKNFPYYVFFHGMLDPWFNQTYFLKKIKKSLYWTCIEKHLIAKAKGLLFTAEQEKIKAQPSLVFYHNNQYVVNYGIHPPYEDYTHAKNAFLEKHPQLKTKKILLFLSRIHPKKGTDLLIHAWNTFWEKHPNHEENWVLMIVGPHTEKEKKYYQALINTAKKSLRPILFIPFLEGDEKWGAIAASQFFILPSHQENFGMVVVEALAAQTPVLISNAIDIGTIIQDYHAGFVEKDTAEGTYTLIKKALLIKDHEYKALKNQTHICFNENFNLSLAQNTIHTIIKNDFLTPPRCQTPTTPIPS